MPIVNVSDLGQLAASLPDSSKATSSALDSIANSLSTNRPYTPLTQPGPARGNTPQLDARRANPAPEFTVGPANGVPLFGLSSSGNTDRGLSDAMLGQSAASAFFGTPSWQPVSTPPPPPVPAPAPEPTPAPAVANIKDPVPEPTPEPAPAPAPVQAKGQAEPLPANWGRLGNRGEEMAARERRYMRSTLRNASPEALKRYGGNVSDRFTPEQIQQLQADRAATREYAQAKSTADLGGAMGGQESPIAQKTFSGPPPSVDSSANGLHAATRGRLQSDPAFRQLQSETRAIANAGGPAYRPRQSTVMSGTAPGMPSYNGPGAIPIPADIAAANPMPTAGPMPDVAGLGTAAAINVTGNNARNQMGSTYVQRPVPQAAPAPVAMANVKDTVPPPAPPPLPKPPAPAPQATQPAAPAPTVPGARLAPGASTPLPSANVDTYGSVPKPPPAPAPVAQAPKRSISVTPSAPKPMAAPDFPTNMWQGGYKPKPSPVTASSLPKPAKPLSMKTSARFGFRRQAPMYAPRPMAAPQAPAPTPEPLSVGASAPIPGMASMSASVPKPPISIGASAPIEGMAAANAAAPSGSLSGGSLASRLGIGAASMMAPPSPASAPAPNGGNMLAAAPEHPAANFTMDDAAPASAMANIKDTIEEPVQAPATPASGYPASYGRRRIFNGNGPIRRFIQSRRKYGMHLSAEKTAILHALAETIIKRAWPYRKQQAFVTLVKLAQRIHDLNDVRTAVGLTYPEKTASQQAELSIRLAKVGVRAYCTGSK